MKRNWTIRNKKKRNALEIFEKRGKWKFPTRNHYCRFCVRKNGWYRCRWRQVLSLLPSFRQFNDEQNFLAPMEILKIMRHIELQQNLDMYSSCSLPSFSNANSFLPNSSHFATNPQNPQPVTESDIWNTVICENKYFLTLVLLPVSLVVAQTGVVEYFRR